MSKVLRLRFLLPLLVVVYVGGIIWASSSSVVTGHIIFAVCAVMGILVTYLAFGRYDTMYRDPSRHGAIFRASALAGGLFGLLAVFHVLAITLGFDDVYLVSLAEIIVVSVFVGGLLARFNDDVGKRRKQQDRAK